MTAETPDAVAEVVTTPEPGFYQGVDFDTYVAWDAYNASTLKGFSKTPAHVAYDLASGGKKRTKALDLGWYVHLAVLEPERFKAEVVVPPKVDARTKEGKRIRDEFKVEHEHSYIVDADTFRQVRGMGESLMRHPTAREFYEAQGFNEVSILWDDDEHEARCKARIDRISTIGGWPIVGDLKTTKDASRRSFERSILNFGYDISAAHYLKGLEKLVPIPDGNAFRRFVFFAVESSPPFCVAVYELDDLALEEGAAKRSRYIRQWKECDESGVWGGYPDGIEYISLPPWAFKRFEDIS